MEVTKVEVSHSFMKHESGSKFYQIYGFGVWRVDDNDKERYHEVTVTHWGKMASSGRRDDMRPVVRGQFSIHHDVAGLAASTFAEKSKRGYAVEHHQEHTFLPRVRGDEEKLKSWMTKEFGAATAHSLLLSIDLIGSEIEMEARDAAPAPKRATQKTLPEPERPASWGSW